MGVFYFIAYVATVANFVLKVGVGAVFWKNSIDFS
jgi:hypothetical protein